MSQKEPVPKPEPRTASLHEVRFIKIRGGKIHLVVDEDAETFEIDEDGTAWGYTACSITITGELVRCLDMNKLCHNCLSAWVGTNYFFSYRGHDHE